MGKPILKCEAPSTVKLIDTWLARKLHQYTLKTAFRTGITM